MAGKVIDKIYFITHPAYPLYEKGSRDKEIGEYIGTHLNALLDRVGKEANSLVVFSRTPTDPRFVNAEYKAGRLNKKDAKDIYKRVDARGALVKQFEDGLEMEVMKLGANGIVTNERILAGDNVTHPAKVLSEIRKRGFELSKDLTIYGHGAYYKDCAPLYPFTFGLHVRQEYADKRQKLNVKLEVSPENCIHNIERPSSHGRFKAVKKLWNWLKTRRTKTIKYR